MKKYILALAAALMAFSAAAQDFDTDPTLKIENKDKDVKFAVGARMMADAAYYRSEFTPLQSGASIVDARIRTSMAYRNWYFYADFGFGGGKFAQKNIYMQYTHNNKHIFKGGYYNDPAGSMANITSLGSYHFISRPGSAGALREGRQLGLTYKFNTDHFQAYQGVFTENAYNKIEAGFNGVSVAGRYIYRPIADGDQTLHIGVNARFSQMGGGVVTNNVLQKTLHLGQALETYVDTDEQFVSCDLPWIDKVIDAGAEFLYHNSKFFVRGEYMYKHTTKKRDSNTLWEASNNNIDTWGSYDWWLAANPIRPDNFHGAYVEAGFTIFGKPYKYNSAEGILGGLDGQTLEVVARWNYTDLNDVNEGEYYSVGRDQYYPGGVMADWPYASSSVGGGRVNSFTLGLNYSVNHFVLFMLDYTYHNLKKDKLPYDNNIHMIQARMQFTF